MQAEAVPARAIDSTWGHVCLAATSLLEARVYQLLPREIRWPLSLLLDGHYVVCSSLECICCVIGVINIKREQSSCNAGSISGIGAACAAVSLPCSSGADLEPPGHAAMGCGRRSLIPGVRAHPCNLPSSCSISLQTLKQERVLCPLLFLSSLFLAQRRGSFSPLRSLRCASSKCPLVSAVQNKDLAKPARLEGSARCQGHPCFNLSSSGVWAAHEGSCCRTALLWPDTGWQRSRRSTGGHQRSRNERSL